MNPLNLRGGEFLVLYVVLFFVAGLATVFLKWWLRTPRDLPRVRAEYDPYELAFLIDRERGVVSSAVAALVHRGAIKPKRYEKKLLRARQPVGRMHWVEQKVYDSIPIGEGTTYRQLRKGLDGSFNSLAKPLIEEELILQGGPVWAVSLQSSIPLASLLILGLGKIVVGISRDKPVSILAIFCFITFITLLVNFYKTHKRTVRGDKVLKAIRDANEPLKVAAGKPSAVLTPDQIAMAAALFGVAIFLSSELQALAGMMEPHERAMNASGHSCSSSCSSGGDGGGCGGGCGGCGGGD